MIGNITFTLWARETSAADRPPPRAEAVGEFSVMAVPGLGHFVEWQVVENGQRVQRVGLVREVRHALNSGIISVYAEVIDRQVPSAAL